MAKKVDVTTEPKAKTKRKLLAKPALWAWTGVVVLAIFEALIANNQATSGQHLADLEQQQTSLSVIVDDLERRVAESGSLQTIKERATDQLGLAPVDKNVMYLAWPTPVSTEGAR